MKIVFHLPTFDHLQKSFIGKGGAYHHTRKFHEWALCTINNIDKSGSILEDGRLPTCCSLKIYHLYFIYYLNYWIKKYKDWTMKYCSCSFEIIDKTDIINQFGWLPGNNRKIITIIELETLLIC